MKDLLITIFRELDEWMEAYNADIDRETSEELRPIEVRVLGQFTLLANDIAAQVLTLQRTNDLDAVLRDNDWNIKRILNQEILPKHGLELDSQSEEIWIPPSATYDVLHDFKNVRIRLLDPESALVSKAVKAKEKNKNLIIQAIASEAFPHLVERIKAHGGDLDYFLGDDNEEE